MRLYLQLIKLMKRGSSIFGEKGRPGKQGKETRADYEGDTRSALYPPIGKEGAKNTESLLMPGNAAGDND